MRRLARWLMRPLRAYEAWWGTLTPAQQEVIIQAQIDAKRRGLL